MIYRDNTHTILYNIVPCLFNTVNVTNLLQLHNGLQFTIFPSFFTIRLSIMFIIITYCYFIIFYYTFSYSRNISLKDTSIHKYFYLNPSNI